ncbi:hypothetical protein CLOP_g21262, partial [Closterium sp. NIES-67]
SPHYRREYRHHHGRLTSPLPSPTSTTSSRSALRAAPSDAATAASSSTAAAAPSTHYALPLASTPSAPSSHFSSSFLSSLIGWGQGSGSANSGPSPSHNRRLNRASSTISGVAGDWDGAASSGAGDWDSTAGKGSIIAVSRREQLARTRTFSSSTAHSIQNLASFIRSPSPSGSVDGGSSFTYHTSGSTSSSLRRHSSGNGLPSPLTSQRLLSSASAAAVPGASGASGASGAGATDTVTADASVLDITTRSSGPQLFINPRVTLPSSASISETSSVRHSNMANREGLHRHGGYSGARAGGATEAADWLSELSDNSNMDEVDQILAQMGLRPGEMVGEGGVVGGVGADGMRGFLWGCGGECRRV